MTQPPPQYQPPQYPAYTPPPAAPKKKTKLVWIPIVLGIVVVFIIGIAIGNAGKSTTTVSSGATVTKTVTAGVAAPTGASSSASSAAPKTSEANANTLHKVGETATVKFDSFTAKGTVSYTVNAITMNAPASQYFKPQNGQFVVVDITVVGVSGTGTDYNAFDWKIQTPDGKVWQPGGLGSFDPTLNSGDLTTGQTVRGNVVFDIPAGPITSVQLSPALLNKLVASWGPA